MIDSDIIYDERITILQYRKQSIILFDSDDDGNAE